MGGNSVVWGVELELPAGTKLVAGGVSSNCVERGCLHREFRECYQ